MSEENGTQLSEDAQKSILIVDDDPTYAKMVREWLRESYQVSVVVNAVQTMTILEKKKIDLILLDYEMPELSGPKVLEMIRKEPATSKIPIVFLTGIGDAASVGLILSLHPDGYILKSTSREELLAWLTQYFH